MRSWQVSTRRAVVGVVVATVVTVVAWRTGGWFDTGGRDRNLTAARVLLWLTTFGIVYAVPPLFRRMSRPVALVFAFWTVYGGLWLLAMWPGLVMTDTHAQVVYIQSGTVWDWFSYLHSVLNMMVFDVVPHVAAFGPLQVLGMAGLMAFASAVLLEVRHNIPALAAMNAIAALSAPVVVNTLLYSRDTPYTLGLVALALYLGRSLVLKRRISPQGVAGVALATGFLAAYRGDGVALLVVVPLVLLLVLRPSRGAIVRGAGAFAASVLLFFVVLPHLVFDVYSDPHRYELSLKINPLGAVLQSNFYSQNKDEDLRQLGRVIDVEGVKELSEPSEITPFWLNKWNPEASEDDWKAFNQTADRLLRENAWTVFANRIETFGAATGLAPGQFATAPLYRANRFSYVGIEEGIKADAPFPGLYDKGATIISRTKAFTGAISTHSAIHWNFLPWMFVLLVALALWRRLPLEAVVAAVLLSRVPLIFIAAPAAQFKYYYSVHLGGIVVLGLMLARVRREHVARFVPALREQRRATTA